MGERPESRAQPDMLLPIANVVRIMKKILSSHAKISKEAQETIQESASEFISFVVGEASAVCLEKKRRALNGDDICAALRNLGMDDLANASRVYLLKYREAEALRLQDAVLREQELDLFGVSPLLRR